ncbi:MAG: gamma-glutamylcyclotransferase (GGCT)/AIG2-like uncharacterized protein YtfP [Hyphomicrobiaceae bacterium]|jgi:gamma-glutamylcyclotransferase (GGCT)/AIG2-like uncharacterized protein YtfP
MDHLFVYGTLLSNARDALGAAMRARLSNETGFIGPGSTPGRLYDLGDYPGLIEAQPRDRDLVMGEVLELHDANATFRWLDLYEDVDPNDPAAGLYRRVPQLALLNDGRAIRCWVYALNDVPGQNTLIAGGCWLSHVAADN